MRPRLCKPASGRLVCSVSSAPHMCVLGLAVLTSDDVPFVAAHSRDEYFARPVGPLRLEADGLLLARDAAGGGTWAGLNTTTGVYASVTNVRDAAAPTPPPSAPSRGLLVVDVLRGRTLAPARWRDCTRPFATSTRIASRSTGRLIS